MSKELLSFVPVEKRDAFLVDLYGAFFGASKCEIYVGDTYLKIVSDWWPCYIKQLDIIKYEPSCDPPLVIPSVVLSLEGGRHGNISLEGEAVYTYLRLPFIGKIVDGQVVKTDSRKLLGESKS